MTEDEARTIRDSLLKNSDHMVLADSPYDTNEIRAYRQALRDVPQQPNFPENIIWPVIL